MENEETVENSGEKAILLEDYHGSNDVFWYETVAEIAQMLKRAVKKTDINEITDILHEALQYIPYSLWDEEESEENI